MQRFAVAPYGVTAWIWTIGFVGAMLYFLGRSAWEYANGVMPELFDVAAGVLLLVMVVWGWIRSVRGYRVTEESVVIERAGPGKLHIPLEKLRRVERPAQPGSFLNPGFLSLGGLFGWAGSVNVRKPQDVQSLVADVYGTNPSYAVNLDLESGRTIVVTPRDPAAFVQAVREADSAKKGRGAGGQVPAGGSGKSKRRRR